MIMRYAAEWRHGTNGRKDMNSSESIRIAIVEDDPAAQEALRLLIDDTEGFRCVGSFGSAEQALRTLREPAPDVLLLDISLPGMPGSQAVLHFHERHPAMAILMLTLHDDEERIFESLCNGAAGYLLKRTPPDRLLHAIREARDNGAPMSPEIAHKVVRLFRKIRPPAKQQTDLTRLEIKLLSLLSEGFSYQTAADEMRVSINTVRNYIRSIYEKLQVHSKSEAVSKALKSGLI